MKHNWETVKPSNTRTFDGVSVGEHYIALSTSVSRSDDFKKCTMVKVFIDKDNQAIKIDPVTEMDKDVFILNHATQSAKIMRKFDGLPQGRYLRSGDKNIFCYEPKSK